MRHALSAFLLAAASTVASAQGQTGGAILTLDEAVTLAVRNNPTHLRSVTAEDRAGASVRSSYGAFLPNVNTNFTTSFRQGGAEVVSGQQFGSAADILSSSYGIGVNASYSVSTFLQPRVAKANLNAAGAEVTRSAATTRSDVVQQYLTVLQAQATAALRDTLLANAQAQVDLNRAREQVGATTSLVVRQSEVALGNARVNLLRDRNAVETEMLRLFQLMGVQKIEGVRLTTTFSVTEPSLQVNELLIMARQANPALNAARAREDAANVAVSQARSGYLPSVSFSTGWSGSSLEQTNIEPAIEQRRQQTATARSSCLTQDSLRFGAGLAPRGVCDQIQFTDADADQMRAANNQYPFTFSKQPFGYSVQFSLPIFNGFRREENVQNAAASRLDARYAVRATELQLITDITSSYNNLMVQYQTVQVQEQTRATAQQALELAQERYRVGASTFLDVSQARTDYETAGNDLIRAIYDFHRFYVQLETAVGRPLR